MPPLLRVVRIARYQRPTRRGIGGHIYLVLRLFAVPMLFHNPATLGLVWLYIFVAGAPPPSIRAGVVKTFVLAAPLFVIGPVVLP
ncbi:MAG TPA: ComEC/Rec2 family competence protein [Rubrobacteraceae bacterium]|nr:ComEC/Rec2 family competence protein [Rubrobacteraceae bacterium]